MGGCIRVLVRVLFYVLLTKCDLFKTLLDANTSQLFVMQAVSHSGRLKDEYIIFDFIFHCLVSMWRIIQRWSRTRFNMFNIEPAQVFFRDVQQVGDPKIDPQHAWEIFHIAWEQLENDNCDVGTTLLTLPWLKISKRPRIDGKDVLIKSRHKVIFNF